MLFPKTDRQAEFMALADRLAERCAARAGAHDRDNTFPFDNFADLHASGYLALTVPEAYGGRGADPLEIALAQERLARGDGSTALAATMHLLLIGRLAEGRVWPEATFARVCRAVVAEGALINSAASEPDLGSPSRGGLPSTIAVRDGDGYRITGRKNWTSLAPALRYFVIMVAVQDDGQPPRRANFLIEAGAPGLRVEETWDNLGMRATASHDIVLENVWAPADARLPDDGTTAAGDSRGWALVTGAVYTGIATAARDYAIQYARERRPSGLSGPIAEVQTVQHRVAEIELLLLQSRAVLYGTAEGWVERPECHDALGWQLAAAKHITTNNAIRVTDLALRVVGAAGLNRARPLERYFRDVRAGLGHPPIDDAALTLIGRQALGL
ncbi:MAG: acyl-CoA/acyl-ACP dehydrogenase [Chloroflexi bacterium]|nr:acyl-CoA/acyl-ACP dehydrogenase [Chloroflexota bacterium]